MLGLFLCVSCLIHSLDENGGWLSRIIYRKANSFFPFMKPLRGTRCLFIAKTVKNSEISHFKRGFCDKSAKSGFKLTKTAKSTIFYQSRHTQTSPGLFYPYEVAIAT